VPPVQAATFRHHEPGFSLVLLACFLLECVIVDKNSFRRPFCFFSVAGRPEIPGSPVHPVANGGRVLWGETRICELEPNRHASMISRIRYLLVRDLSTGPSTTSFRKIRDVFGGEGSDLGSRTGAVLDHGTGKTRTSPAMSGNCSRSRLVSQTRDPDSSHSLVVQGTRVVFMAVFWLLLGRLLVAGTRKI